MKKLLLFVFVLAGVINSFAQKIDLQDGAGNSIVGDTLVFWHAVDPSIFQLDFHHENFVTIMNASTDSIRVDVLREEIDTIAGTGDYFCWGTQCFNVNNAGTLPMWFANDPVKSGPNSVVGGIGFSIYMAHNKKVGEAKYSYEFYDIDNQSDPTKKAKLFIRYSLSYLTGLSEELKTVDFGMFPNPSKNQTQIKFNKPMRFENQVVEVYNLLGKKQKSIQLNSGVENLILDTEELSAGVYFVNILVEGKLIATKKLIKK